MKRRIKWEPAALMVVVLGIGLWIAFGPAGRHRFPVAQDSARIDVVIGETRGVLEAMIPAGNADGGATGGHRFRLWLHGESSMPRIMTESEAKDIFGSALVQRAVKGENKLFRWLNITSWTSMVWIGIGLFGQALFSGRMLLQWITSEKSRKSVINESFWWFSLIGGLVLFSYFIWRRDPVPMIGQAFGIVVYVRNIRLMRKSARKLREHQPSEPSPLGKQEETIDAIG